jgi:hypothetical protein
MTLVILSGEKNRRRITAIGELPPVRLIHPGVPAAGAPLPHSEDVIEHRPPFIGQLLGFPNSGTMTDSKVA